MTILRAPVEIRGDVPGLLGDWVGPAMLRADDGSGTWIPCVSIAFVHAGHRLQLDMSRPECVYCCLHWLADRGHPGCLWMLPTTHGGRVAAWDGLSAWEVSAILVSVSVGRVVGGGKPVKHLLGHYRDETLYGSDGPVVYQTRWALGGVRRIGPLRVVDVGQGGWHYDRAILARGATVQTDDYVKGPETGDPGKLAADRAALADGAALCVDGGIAVGVP